MKTISQWTLQSGIAVQISNFIFIFSAWEIKHIFCLSTFKNAGLFMKAHWKKVVS